MRQTEQPRSGANRASRRLTLPVFLGVGSLLTSLAAGCQGTPAPAPPVVPSAAPSLPASPRQQLAKLLSEVPLQGAVVEALPADTRRALDELVGRLPPGERAELQDEDGPFPERRPLLHLVSGGNSPRARLALATSPAGVEMLLLTRGTTEPVIKSLLPVVRELAARAAAAWLRERSSAVASDDVLTAEHYQQLGQAAEVLREHQAAHLALGLAAELEPSADRSLEHAAAAARVGAAVDAERALARAGKAGDPGLRRRVKPMVAAALRLAKAEPGGDPAARLARAQDLVVIGDFEQAQGVLADKELPRGLALAVLQAKAAFENSSCPGVPTRLASPILCRTAFQTHPGGAAALERLDAAWKSKAGRDPAAVSGYVSLRYAIPFLYGMDVAEKSEQEARKALVARLTELEGVAAEASATSERFAHVGLFVNVLSGAVAQPEGSPPEEAGKLLKAADAALSCAGCDQDVAARLEWSQAAVLAALARASGDVDVRPVLSKLPDPEDARYRHAKTTLLGWSALAAGDKPGTEQAIAALARIIGEGSEHSDTVLELAELQHATAPDERTQSVLESAGKRLSQLPVPFELRARGALDAAGVVAARKDIAAAIALLEPLISKSPKVVSRVEGELLELVHSYLLVLRGRLAKGAERAEYVKKLAARRGPTRVVDEWRSLWVKEFARLPQKEACGANAACVAAVAKRARPTPAELEKRLGATAASLIQRGVLGIRSAEMALAAEAHLELGLDVDFRPLWLSVEVPY